MKTVKVYERALISDDASHIAQALRGAEAVAQFPGVERALAGIPGIRLDTRFMSIHDRLVLTRVKPVIEQGRATYRFGVEGGKWVAGAGAIHVMSNGPKSDVALELDMEMPVWAYWIPGLRTAFGVWLSRATRIWLRKMRRVIEANMRSCADGPLTVTDVGA